MEHNQEKALHLLGIARKANRLAIGEEPAGIACRSGKARLLLVAQDAGEHTVRRAQSFCRSGKPRGCRSDLRRKNWATALAATLVRSAPCSIPRWPRRSSRRWAQARGMRPSYRS